MLVSICAIFLLIALLFNYKSVVEKGGSYYRKLRWKMKTEERTAYADRLENEIKQSLRNLGLWDSLFQRMGEDKDRGFGQKPRSIQIRVPADLSTVVCNLEIARAVRQLGAEITEASEEIEKKTVTLNITKDSNTFLTLSLIPDSRIVRRTGMIALILDDFGFQSIDLIKRFCLIGQNLTFSIFPEMENSAKISQLVYGSGHQVMIHLPMESHNPDENPGKSAIRVNLTNDEIVKETRKALKSVPYAIGVNNHMGSRATEDRRVMKEVLGVVKGYKFFFIDSFTSPASVGQTIAKEIRLKSARRNIFIDNVDEPKMIESELDRAGRLSIEKGEIVAVGHGKPNTLVALEEMLPKLDRRGIKFIYVSQIVR